MNKLWLSARLTTYALLGLLTATPALYAQEYDCNSNGLADEQEIDSDTDGIIDYCDNCLLIPNENQIDSDNDGFGNLCDADFNDSGLVDLEDRNFIINSLGSNEAAADLDGNGFVDQLDLTIVQDLLDKAPGPGVLADGADLPLIYLEDAIDYPITELENQTVKMKVQVSWKQKDIGEFMEHQDPEEVQLTPIVAHWQEADSHIPAAFHHEGRGNLFLISPFLRKDVDDQGETVYYYLEQKLPNIGNYELIGKIKYREWLTPAPVEDEHFIKQSNDPTYWKQTFEFVVERLVLL